MRSTDKTRHELGLRRAAMRVSWEMFKSVGGAGGWRARKRPGYYLSFVLRVTSHWLSEVACRAKQCALRTATGGLAMGVAYPLAANHRNPCVVRSESVYRGK